MEQERLRLILSPQLSDAVQIQMDPDDAVKSAALVPGDAGKRLAQTLFVLQTGPGVGFPCQSGAAFYPAQPEDSGGQSGHKQQDQPGSCPYRARRDGPGRGAVQRLKDRPGPLRLRGTGRVFAQIGSQHIRRDLRQP